MTWQELSVEARLAIGAEIEKNEKSPLQIMLDAGVTPSDSWIKSLQKAERLLERIKAKLPLLEEWLDDHDDEDEVYRFYHQSFKVFGLVYAADKGYELIVQIGGEDCTLDGWYLEIYRDGTRYKGMREVQDQTGEDMNQHWLKYARPITEAFWHTDYFIRQMVKYGKELKFAPAGLPSGWAAILALYNLRG
jgi:hypothetical protein